MRIDQMNNYNDATCTSVNWMKNIRWLITPYSSTVYVWRVTSDGDIALTRTDGAGSVFPVLYLNSDAMVIGEGSSVNPYRVSVS